MCITVCYSSVLHLRKLLTPTLLFWHFLKNLNFEFKNILKYIRTMFSGNTRLFSKTSNSELLKYGKFELKTSKNESRKFNQCGKQNNNLSLYSIFMRYDSELFSNVGQSAIFYS